MLVGVYAVALLVALVLHEVAHAFAAYKAGDPTAKLSKRLSLNPIRHLDPLGTVFLVIMGFGWAKPVPVNPFNYKNFRKGNFWVSISGVLTNLVIAIVSSFFMYLTSLSGLGNVWMFGLFHLFFFLTVINVLFMLFNLLPIFPLDGYNVLVSFTKPNNKFMAFMRQNSMFILPIVLIVLIATNALSHVQLGIFRAVMGFWGLMF